jgi:putative ABC transport system permease protein
VAGKTETRGGDPSLSTVRKITIEDARALAERCPTLTHVAPIRIGSSCVKYGNRSRNVLVIGTSSEFCKIRTFEVEVGDFMPEGRGVTEKRVCAIGRKVKDELFYEENPLGRMITIEEAKFRVIGVMKKKGRSLGFDMDDMVFIPTSAAQELFKTTALTEVQCSVASDRHMDAAKKQIKDVLIKRHDNEEDFTIYDQGDMLSMLDKIFNVLSYALAGIASISLIVGGVGIMNIMLVSVAERTREIGIRKAVGAKSRHILIQFMLEAVTLSLLGGAVGVGLGVGVVYGAAKLLPSFPLSTPLWAVIVSFSFSLVVGVFFGVYPARRAAKLHPIDALRYE